jgi:hypothetical protein
VSRVVEELLGHELAIAPSFDQGVQGPPAVGGQGGGGAISGRLRPWTPLVGALVVVVREPVFRWEPVVA